MFLPIEDEGQLPAVGRSNENRSLDFKSQPTDDSFEIAKDVAAFANSEGGTILIGAQGKGEHLAAYVPMTSSDASNAQRVYDLAVADRCRPLPAFNVSLIPKDGGILLAINVWPFPGQLVGVAVKKGEAKCGKRETQPEGLFFFPTRIGAHTKAVTPEQMPMFMDPKARRTAISLQQAIGKTIIVSSSKFSKGLWVESATVQDVDFLGNSVALLLTPNKTPVLFSLPFDLVEAVWRAGDQWHMIIPGSIDELDGALELGSDVKPITVVFNPNP